MENKRIAAIRELLGHAKSTSTQHGESLIVPHELAHALIVEIPHYIDEALAHLDAIEADMKGEKTAKPKPAPKDQPVTLYGLVSEVNGRVTAMEARIMEKLQHMSEEVDRASTRAHQARQECRAMALTLSKYLGE